MDDILTRVLALLILLALAGGLVLLWRKGTIPGWVAGIVGGTVAIAAAAGATLLRRGPAPLVAPVEPPPKAPSRDVVVTGTTIVLEVAKRKTDEIDRAGEDVDRLADIGRGQS